MMLDQSIKRNERVHHHMMEKTLFISLLAIHSMVEEKGVSHSSVHYANKGAYDQLYHYGIDIMKRQRIALLNKKYTLNTHY